MLRVQRFILRIVRCTIHRHCNHCHCHYQSCQCRIHFPCYLRRNYYPVLYHLTTWAFQQVPKTVVATMLVMVRVVVVVFLVLHTGFDVIVTFWISDFISSSGNRCSLNHKGTSWPSTFLVHPELQWSTFVSQRSMQWLHW